MREGPQVPVRPSDARRPTEEAAIVDDAEEDRCDARETWPGSAASLAADPPTAHHANL